MNIRWFGHSCFRIDMDGASILTDPFLNGNPVFERSPVSYDAAIEGVTHVALTHGHDDHVGDAVAICKSTGAKLIAQFELAMYLNARGIENIDPTNPGGTVDQGAFSISFTNALHSSSTIVDGKPIYLGVACGIVIRAGAVSIYHMGDTEIFPGMALIKELYAPTVGFVPIGDRFTMGARSAALACRRYFDFKTIIPCHYGTFPIIDQTADAFVTEMAGHNVVVPPVGDVVEV